MEYIPAVLLYSIGVFMLGYQFGKAKYEYTLEELTRIYAEEENEKDTTED